MTTNWKLIGLIVLALALMAITVRVMVWREDAHKTAALQTDIKEGNAGNAASEEIGINLNAGQGKYETDAYELDQQVDTAPNKPVHDVGSVQRTQARISAGISSRKRASGL